MVRFLINFVLKCDPTPQIVMPMNVDDKGQGRALVKMKLEKPVYRTRAGLIVTRSVSEC
jgi:hypothetical protein